MDYKQGQKNMYNNIGNTFLRDIRITLLHKYIHVLILKRYYGFSTFSNTYPPHWKQIKLNIWIFLKLQFLLNKKLTRNIQEFVYFVHVVFGVTWKIFKGPYMLCTRLPTRHCNVFHLKD